MTIWIVSITIGALIYFVLMFFWMRYTFKYNTLNKYAFKRSLEKDDFMLYIEMAMVILLLIGFITNIISQIQIFFIRKKNGKN